MELAHGFYDHAQRVSINKSRSQAFRLMGLASNRVNNHKGNQEGKLALASAKR